MGEGSAVSNLYRRVFEIAERRERRFQHRWVLSPGHVQEFHDEENERRRKERERLAAIPVWLPGFDPTEHIKRNAPLPPPDYAKADEMRLMGWPVRIDDVDEMTLERVTP